MHKIRALCRLIRTETLQNATSGRGHGYTSSGIIAHFSLPAAISCIIYKKIVLRYLSLKPLCKNLPAIGDMNSYSPATQKLGS